MRAGFYKRRRGILEQIESGEIDPIENGIHDYLSLKANLVIGSPCSIPVGISFTLLAAGRSGNGERRDSVRYVLHATYYHSQRSGIRRKPDSPLAQWWQSMRVYEGARAKPRPADLVVP